MCLTIPEYNQIMEECEELCLRRLVEKLTLELGQQKENGLQDIEAGVNILKAYNAGLLEWKSFAFWDDHRYTRNLIATDNQTFTLMLLCWDKGQKSPIHDHAGSQCWLRVVSGTAEEEVYYPPASECAPLVLKKRSIHPEGAVCFINDDVGLHRIHNASDDEVLVTLHCYSPPFDQCHSFLDETAEATQCQVTYFSENGVMTQLH